MFWRHGKQLDRIEQTVTRIERDITALLEIQTVELNHLRQQVKANNDKIQSIVQANQPKE